jgi:predicted ATPase
MMHIKLENIGIIKESMIALDGLTVITGKNNSGKSTVGKALYALLDAVCDLQDKAKKDRQNYILTHLIDVEKTLTVFRFTRVRRNQSPDWLDGYPALRKLFTGAYRNEYPNEGLENYAHELADELAALNVSAPEEEERNRYSIESKLDVAEEYGNHAAAAATVGNTRIYDDQRNEARSTLKHLFAQLNKDIDLVDYARESINQTLRVEFCNQVQPVRAAVPYSRIELSDDGNDFFYVTIKDNKVVNDGNPVFFNSPYKRVYLVDDPFVLDDISMPGKSRMIFGLDMAGSDTLLNPNRIVSHNSRLLKYLRSQQGLSVFEQTVLDDSLRDIKAEIDRIIPGTFDFSPDGAYYIQNGMKLNLSNLATGSKMFSIVKMLLERGTLDKNTMLILDEPEAHLHPQWQNAFAEILVLLVKNLGVTILLTTHSPNFMLALDANMREYDMAEKTNFYQTDIDEDGFVKYHCANDDMGVIYQDFLRYLSESKILRNKYLYNSEE